MALPRRSAVPWLPPFLLAWAAVAACFVLREQTVAPHRDGAMRRAATRTLPPLFRRQVLITPPPKEGDGDGSVAEASRTRGSVDAGDEAPERPPLPPPPPQPSTPNWMFLYPRACTRLLPSNSTVGASVRSVIIFDIPPNVRTVCESAVTFPLGV